MAKQSITKLNIKLPVMITAGDYHEFYPLAMFLSNLTGTKIKYKEVTDDAGYYAVFYTGRFPSKDVINDLKQVYSEW